MVVVSLRMLTNSGRFSLIEMKVVADADFQKDFAYQAVEPLLVCSGSD